MNREDDMNWKRGDMVVVQVPQQDGTTDDFHGKVLEVRKDKLITVLPTEANAGTIHCKSEWLSLDKKAKKI